MRITSFLMVPLLATVAAGLIGACQHSSADPKYRATLLDSVGPSSVLRDTYELIFALDDVLEQAGNPRVDVQLASTHFSVRPTRSTWCDVDTTALHPQRDALAQRLLDEPWTNTLTGDLRLLRAATVLRMSYCAQQSATMDAVENRMAERFGVPWLALGAGCHDVDVIGAISEGTPPDALFGALIGHGPRPSWITHQARKSGGSWVSCDAAATALGINEIQRRGARVPLASASPALDHAARLIPLETDPLLRAAWEWFRDVAANASAGPEDSSGRSTRSLDTLVAAAPGVQFTYAATVKPVLATQWIALATRLKDAAPAREELVPSYRLLAHLLLERYGALPLSVQAQDAARSARIALARLPPANRDVDLRLTSFRLLRASPALALLDILDGQPRLPTGPLRSPALEAVGALQASRPEGTPAQHALSLLRPPRISLEGAAHDVAGVLACLGEAAAPPETGNTDVVATITVGPDVVTTRTMTVRQTVEAELSEADRLSEIQEVRAQLADLDAEATEAASLRVRAERARMTARERGMGVGAQRDFDSAYDRADEALNAESRELMQRRQALQERLELIADDRRTKRVSTERAMTVSTYRTPVQVDYVVTGQPAASFSDVVEVEGSLMQWHRRAMCSVANKLSAAVGQVRDGQLRSRVLGAVAATDADRLAQQFARTGASEDFATLLKALHDGATADTR